MQFDFDALSDALGVSLDRTLDALAELRRDGWLTNETPDCAPADSEWRRTRPQPTHCCLSLLAHRLRQKMVASALKGVPFFVDDMFRPVHVKHAPQRPAQADLFALAA
jgi:hypothetical protein